MPLKLDNLLFEKALTANGITKKAFARYAKIPYYTVAGWKKSGKVPAYAMVIVRDMSYRKRLDETAKQQMARRDKHGSFTEIDLLPGEKKRIEAAFWGTNYTAEEIIHHVRNGDKKWLTRFSENTPQKLQDKVLGSGQR